MTSPLFPFETRLHREALSVHRPHHIGVTDPAVTAPESVKAWHVWRQPDSETAPTKFIDWLRNPGNSAWLFVNAWHLEQTYTDGQVPVADVDGYFLPGDVDGGGSGGPATVAIQDEGAAEGDADTIDFTGAGVSVTFAAGKATVDIPGSGGAITQAYVGYNTVGGTWETMTAHRAYAKKVTLANDCLVTNIEAHLRNTSAGADDQVHTFSVAIYSDSAGTPALLIASNQSGDNTNPSMMLDAASGATGDDVARWYGTSIGKWLTAGDYWIVVQQSRATTPSMQIAYDATGSDRYYTSGGPWFTDWGFYTPTTSSNQYSIRANTIR